MSDIKWIKLSTNMPNDEKIKLIDAMAERDTIHYVWIRILLLGGKVNANGEIFLSETKPLTPKMLAILFSRPLETIKLALKVLSQFGMIEIAPDKVIKIVNWEKYQNIEGMERVREQNRKRAENHREKKKLEKNASENDKEGEEIITSDESEESNLSKINENETIDENEKLKAHESYKNKTTSISLENNSDVIDYEVNSNNLLKTTNNKENVSEKSCNVTQTESNVMVTEQSKKEIKNKIKKEKKEIDIDNNTCEVINKSLTSSEDFSKSDLLRSDTRSESAAEEDINSKALELMHYHEKIAGKIGGCDYVALRSAIDLYGERRVKMAMKVGFENNCLDIKYAIGVLKNWERDGYPKENMGVRKNGIRSYGKGIPKDKNEFTGFKPKKPRKLTEVERKRIEANLI